MGGFQTFQRIMGRAALAGLAALIGLIIWTVQPWTSTVNALRPDTGRPATALAPTDIEPVLSTLLTRIYAAFGQIDEAAIYDGLAKAVASDLLTDLYLQRRAVQARGSENPEDPEVGTAEITDLRLDDWSVLERDPNGYLIQATWTVVAVVGHEDHRHERINTYAARLTLGPAEGEWRLTRFDLDQVQRQDAPLFFDAFE